MAIGVQRETPEAAMSSQVLNPNSCAAKPKAVICFACRQRITDEELRAGGHSHVHHEPAAFPLVDRFLMRVRSTVDGMRDRRGEI